MDNSKAESVNPYAPPGSPAAVGKSAVAFQWTIEAGLVGDPTAQHLKTHLAIEQSVTALSILGVLLKPVILLPLHLFKPAVFVIASGICGSVFLAPIASMVQYRAALFKNHHPQWMVGKFVLRELRCSMETHGCFIAGVGLASRLLPKRDSFFPPGQSKCHVLVGKRMLQFATPSGVKDEWRSLRGLVQFQLVRRRLSLIRKQGVARDPTRAGRNVEFIFDRERGQTVPIEAGALPVSGVVNTKYVERRPAKVREATRMMRSLIVVALAVFFGALVVGGISDLWLGGFWTLVAVYMMFMVGWHVRTRMHPFTSSSGRHYFLLGQATEHRVWLHLEVAVSSFVWRDTQLLMAEKKLSGCGMVQGACHDREIRHVRGGRAVDSFVERCES